MSSFKFATPAFIEDFPKDPSLQGQLNSRWNTNLDGWCQQAMPAPPSWFYNPAVTAVPSGSAAAPVLWNAFPGRLRQFYSATPPVSPPNPYKLTADQLYSLADTGYYPGPNGKATFQNIPATLCPSANWSGQLKTFGPYGPRGWLDEYCEWAAARNSADNIVRIDFTCENPEYWTTLWKVSPDRVVELYNTTLNFGAVPTNRVAVTLADLQLANVIDPDTGKPAYNPLNKWNSGPVAVRGTGATGGAMHLTSTPNTLQTEIGLTGAATPQYSSGNLDPQALICCGNYGQEYRNSDPHIGQSVSQAVNPHTGSYSLVNLANPFGLYIQMPNFANWTFGPNIVPGQKGIPATAQPSDIWQIVRGFQTVTDPVTGQAFKGNMILHVACQIPEAWLAGSPALTLADIQISGQPIKWAGQIAATFNMALYARPISPSGTAPPSVPCASTITAPLVPLQCMYLAMWKGYYPINESAPTGALLSLASNTTFVAPQVHANDKTVQLALTATTAAQGMSVAFLQSDGSVDPNIIAKVIGTENDVTYAVPGNSYPSSYTVVVLDVTVASGAAPGLRGVQISSGGTQNSLPAAINVI
jgi:hypothetical protein